MTTKASGAPWQPGVPYSEYRLIVRRELSAPRQLVWTAFTDPYHLAQWWGPKGFTSPVCQLDLRPGGKWHHEMQAPDGQRYPVDCTFIEVTPPSRLVYRNDASVDCVFGDNPPPSFLHVLTFEDLGGRTRLTLEAFFESAADRDAVARRGFAEGTNEGFDKLDLYFRQMQQQAAQQ